MKTALVTGAARRLGADLVLELAAMGYSVGIHHRSGGDAARALAAKIRSEGGMAAAIYADLSEPEACSRLIDDTTAALGVVDTLVNNASLFAYDTLQTMTPESWRSAIASNLTAPVFLIQAFARALPAGRAGVVVNLLDQKVERPNPDYFSYTAGKVGLAYLTPALALALAPQIRVCGLSPGLTLPSGDQSVDDFARAAAATPLGLTSNVDAIRRGLRFILESEAFTGQVLTLDGGESLLQRVRDVAYDSSV